MVRYEDRGQAFLPIGGWALHPDRVCAGIIQKIPDTNCNSQEYVILQGEAEQKHIVSK